MQDKLKAGISRQVDAVRVIAWRGKARHHVRVRRPLLHHLRELAQDLRQPLPIPDRNGSVHRRAEEERDFRT